MEQFGLMAAANGQGGGGAPFKPKTLSGVPYDECISGIQKMIRRGKEREALILARELCASGYPAAVARRLMIIACEDIGLASPEVVAQVHTLCMGYLVLKKDARAGMDPEPLAIYMSIMLLARSSKNRECCKSQFPSGTGCGSPRIWRERVDYTLQSFVAEYFTKREVLSSLLAFLNSAPRIGPVMADIEKGNAELARLKAEKTRLLSLSVRGLFDEAQIEPESRSLSEIDFGFRLGGAQLVLRNQLF